MSTLPALTAPFETSTIAAEYAALPSKPLGASVTALAETMAAGDLMLRSLTSHAEAISHTHNERTKSTMERFAEAVRALNASVANATITDHASAYMRDAMERSILVVDVMRERGDNFLEHEAAGCPPVLAYDYEVVVDGRDLPRPCNYQLLRIIPPKGVTVLERKRPYIIVDPRAGHGAGIGGFKPDSQVGVAFHDGHPVYFVAFRRDPEPTQTLADVTHAEATFVRKVMELHPNSPRPVMAGNCQGGWGVLVTNATHTDLTGPIVLNGAPVAPWSGEIGKNPMRYNAGVLGGTWVPMLLSDLGGGVFDGANLVMNFTLLNPSRNFFKKYYDLYAKVDDMRERFLSFERWWGGYFLLNEPEIRWIVSQLFVGNKLVRNEAQLEPGHPIDLKGIQAPIIVFTSHGDNITPPQQALNWIIDTYSDVDEIKIRGQRIVYMIHPDIGHLGIFVSSRIAKKEHTEVASTMKTIEALAPGLYEMKVDSVEGHGHDRRYFVSFAERTFDDIRAVDDGRDDETAFAAVARASELQAELYDAFARPFVQAAVQEPTAHAMRMMHPMRVGHWMFSSLNPFLQPYKAAAGMLENRDKDLAADNPFKLMETVYADLYEQSLDMYRDWRDSVYEMSFYAAWGAPWAQAYGKPNAAKRVLKHKDELRGLPEVKLALLHIDDGGFEDAVVRMLIMLADSRGTVRRDRLERASRVLTQDKPFRELSMEERARIIHEQTIIVTFAGAQAVETLQNLLTDEETRQRACAAVQYIAGPIGEMSPETLTMLQRIRSALSLPPASDDVLEDPLRDPNDGPWFQVLDPAAE
ncbi:MAG: DUF3141 domain-containing protein [Pseudomonadota bacterium]